jgi:nucleoside-diphosphate-sugar epimerase
VDVELASRLDGDVIVLGAAGKMGPTLVRRIVRALDEAGSPHRVVAASRFTEAGSRREIEESGAEIAMADLLNDEDLAELPDCPNVIYLAGMKFGATGNRAQTWAMNAYLPGRVATRFRHARIVALSTGNVYPSVPVSSGGCTELDDLDPVGEYAQSCLGRERIFEFFSRETPTCLIRLNYAAEARYGVLLDIATKVHRGEPVAVDTGYVNVIWQGDANSICFRALELCSSPAAVLNLTGPEILSVRKIAETFAEKFDKKAVFSGEEQPTALLNNAARCHERFGAPRVSVDDIIGLVARWVERGGTMHGKPTKFEVRDGRF